MSAKFYRTAKEQFLDELYQEYKDKPCSTCGSQDPKDIDPIRGGAYVSCASCYALIATEYVGRDGL